MDVARHGAREEAWRLHMQRRERSIFVIANALMAALVPAWTFIDRFLVPAHAEHFFRLRLVATALATAAMVALLRRGSLLRNRLVMLGATVGVSGVVASFIPQAGGQQTPYVFGLSLFFWGAGMVLPWPLAWTVAGWLLSLAIYVAAHFATYGRAEPHALIGALFYLGSAGAISAVNAAVRFRLERRAFDSAADLEESNARLQHMSDTDELTGLRNYRRFTQDLEAEYRRFRRTGQPASLVMLDVDHFKRFNDRHGHEAGNRVLVEIAAILRKTVRDIDVVARYGGEEFCAIVVAPPESAMAAAERIREAVAAWPFQGRETQPGGHLSVSLGVAAFQPDDPGPRDVIERADAALYRSKANGRNLVRAA